MISPLTKHNKDGEPYTRTAPVQAQLERLGALPAAERERQLVSGVTDDDAGIPVEALVHFARQSWRSKNRAATETLFRALHARIGTMIRAAVFDSRVATAATLQTAIADRFVDLLAEDCKDHSDRLDYFEVNCADALLGLRCSALRKFTSDAKREGQAVPLLQKDRESEAESIPKETEEAAARFLAQLPSFLDNPAFRLDLYDAISNLPADQRAVLVLVLEGRQIEAADDETMTISKTLNCTERTVRNRRDRGAAALAIALKEWASDE